MAGSGKAALSVGATLALWLSLSACPTDLETVVEFSTSRHAAIPVENGSAQFDLPTGEPTDQFLVVVSSLQRRGGTFDVEIRAEPIDELRPLRIGPTDLQSAWQFSRNERVRQLVAGRARIQTAPEPPPRQASPKERSFWLQVRGEDSLDRQNYVTVRAHLARAGKHCVVYVDSECVADRAQEQLVADAVRTFDDQVYPTARTHLGRHRDVDGDGRFTILLTPWLGRLAGGTTSVGGFVRASDYFTEITPPLGNRCDMMYLNSNLAAGPHLRTLIAHEYTHAITLSERAFNRYLPDRNDDTEENWLDESIAHLAENLHGFAWSNLDYRISAFLNEPESYRLVVDDYYAADLWRGHGNRGSTYLFLRWCVDQFGDGLLGDLVQTNLNGIENIEVSTGRRFEELFRDWAAALFLSQSGLSELPADEIRHLSLRGTLGGQLLCGPRYDALDLSGDTKTLRVVGTSTKYLIAHSPVASGARLSVSARPDAELQVSVRRLPSTLPRLELAATPIPHPGNDGRRYFQVQIRERNGQPAILSHLAWERILVGSNRETRHGAGFRAFEADQLTSLFGTVDVPAGGTIRCAQFSVDSIGNPESRFVLKAAGHDQHGRAVSAWCNLDLRPSPVASRPTVQQ